MSSRFSRRQLLIGAGRLGLSLAVYEAGRKGLDLLDQHRTWDEASLSNAEFLSRHAGRLANLELGASFAPEEWSLNESGAAQARAGLDLAIRELNLRRLRLGLRWNRVQRRNSTDLRNYAPYLERCLRDDVEICLNVGPVRVFRWPEEHVPGRVLRRTELPPNGAELTPGQPLTSAAFSYLDTLLQTLNRDYGEDLAAVRLLQVENEPFYTLGDHGWGFSFDYLKTVARMADDALPGRRLLVTSAGRLNLDSVRDLYAELLAPPERRFAGRLVSGFDFHYRTPMRDSVPVVRYFDQISFAQPLAPRTDDNIAESHEMDYAIEVTEGQMEPYGQFHQPGNSVRELRYMLLRCLDHVLDPQRPGLIRLWGVEGLVQKMQRGLLTNEHRQMIELIQAINAGSSPQVRAQARQSSDAVSGRRG